jgi:hypothetical protein
VLIKVCVIVSSFTAESLHRMPQHDLAPLRVEKRFESFFSDLLREKAREVIRPFAREVARPPEIFFGLLQPASALFSWVSHR